nr:hypothetical protein Iba_chr13dCG1920 [Ipomoea batatas]
MNYLKYQRNLLLGKWRRVSNERLVMVCTCSAPSCSFHEKKERRFTYFTSWTVWEEENTIVFINHCIRSVCLHHKNLPFKLCCKTLNGNVITKSSSTTISILIYG